jgi:GntR family transcriptional repressor for pyruvate dehydrogenase complex
MPSLQVKRNGLAAQVIDGLRGLIAERSYRVGDRLPPEGDLCALFGVGRSTLREAMRVLASRGIVDVRHGEGTFVASRASRKSFEERIGRAALKDVYEARSILEQPLAELAAQRRDARDIAAMRVALRKRERACAAGDVSQYAEADFAFHLAVAKAAKNRALFDLYESFVHVVAPLLAAATTQDYIRNERDTLHAALCAAIEAADVQQTRRVVRSHLRRSLEGVGALR